MQSLRDRVMRDHPLCMIKPMRLTYKLSLTDLLQFAEIFDKWWEERWTLVEKVLEPEELIGEVVEVDPQTQPYDPREDDPATPPDGS